MKLCDYRIISCLVGSILLRHAGYFPNLSQSQTIGNTRLILCSRPVIFMKQVEHVRQTYLSMKLANYIYDTITLMINENFYWRKVLSQKYTDGTLYVEENCSYCFNTYLFVHLSFRFICIVLHVLEKNKWIL